MTANTPLPDGLAPGVVFVRHDGIGRLLDFDRGRFFGLNPTATELLVSYLEGGVERTLDRLTKQYPRPRSELKADVDAMLGSLHARGLLRSPDARPRRRARLMRWLVAPFGLIHGRGTGRRRIRWLLRRAWLDLRLDHWNRVLDSWRVKPNPSPRPLADLEALDMAIRELAGSTILLPLACKERALVLWYLARAELGLAAELVVGVRHYPFAAHAWVEAAGRILTDDPEHVRLFEPVIRYS